MYAILPDIVAIEHATLPQPTLPDAVWILPSTLPAILITNANPHYFSKIEGLNKNKDDLMLFIPLRKVCKTEDDVANLINNVIKDLIEKKKLPDFKISKEMKKGVGKALISGAILQPNFGGVGFDFKEFIKKLQK